MRAYWPGAKIVVVEQVDTQPFNRGKLLNIGTLESPDDHYVFHDVDMLPLKVNYNTRAGVTQLASSDIQKVNYLGGVTMCDAECFELANGYPNDFFHRAEDNALFFSFQRHGIPIAQDPGLFRLLNHERPAVEFDLELWEKAKRPRTLLNGLVGCKYECVQIQLDNYLLLKCLL
jgi:hypothetical protein